MTHTHADLIAEAKRALTEIRNLRTSDIDTTGFDHDGAMLMCLGRARTIAILGLRRIELLEADILRVAQEDRERPTQAERDAFDRLATAAQEGRIRGNDVQTLVNAAWARQSSEGKATEGVEAALAAGDRAGLPEGFHWGPEAMESFQFGRKRAMQAVREALSQPSEGEGPGAAERCIACLRPLMDGERYFSDASGGFIHADCCGPERESYTNADGEPLGPADPIPEGAVWAASPSPVTRQAVARVFDEWLAMFGPIEIEHTSARDYACDAVKDIRDHVLAMFPAPDLNHGLKSPTCGDCAKAKGLIVPGDIHTVYQGICANCGHDKPISSAWDWRKPGERFPSAAWD